jgi:hypothetical protein
MQPPHLGIDGRQLPFLCLLGLPDRIPAGKTKIVMGVNSWAPAVN